MGLWSKVKKAAKKVAKTAKKVVEKTVDAISTTLGAVVVVFESIVLAWVGGVIGYLVAAILGFPIVGALIDWLFQVVKTLVWRVLGVVDFLLSLIGVRPEKKMRVCVLAYQDKNGFFFGSDANIVKQLNNLITIYKEEANIRVIKSAPFEFGSAFSGANTAKADWIHRPEYSNARVVNVRCDGGAAKDDITKVGSFFDHDVSHYCFYGNFRRLIGYGAPIAILVIKSFKDGKLGCSMGPLTDYVTASGTGIARSDFLFAHECGHACGLRHCGKFLSGCSANNKNNLMYPKSSRGSSLGRWQVAVIRNSRHATYL